jgi:acyl carrier protein
MQAAAVEERLFAVLSSILQVPRESLGPDTSRRTLEEWDSLKHMYVVLALEEEFDVEFSDSELATLNSVASLLEAIMAKASRTG